MKPIHYLLIILMPGVGLGSAMAEISLKSPDSFVNEATYSEVYEGPVPRPGWGYYWNAPTGWVADVSSGDGTSNPLGPGVIYVPLLWSGTQYTCDGDNISGNNQPAGYARLGKDTGHPGLGYSQAGGVTNGWGRYMIAGYTLETEGFYALTNATVNRKSDSTGNINVRVYLGDRQLGRDVIADQNNKLAVFDQNVGWFPTGSVVYVAVGPQAAAAEDSFDTFDFTFAVSDYPRDVSGGITQSDDTIFLLKEKKVTLVDDLVVDLSTNLPGAVVGPNALPGNQVIPADTTVQSWLLHYNRFAEAGSASGIYTFPSDIVGLMYHVNKLYDSDAVLGLTELAYPVAGGDTLYRGCLHEGTDLLFIDGDGRTIDLTAFVGNNPYNVDQIRVLTAAEPDTNVLRDIGMVGAAPDTRAVITWLSATSETYKVATSLMPEGPWSEVAAGIAGQDVKTVFTNGTPLVDQEYLRVEKE